MSIATGYVTIALMVSGRFIFQYLGWATAAFITPMVLMLFGGAFFAFSMSGAPTTARLAVLAGAVTQVCHTNASCLSSKVFRVFHAYGPTSQTPPHQDGAAKELAAFLGKECVALPALPLFPMRSQLPASCCCCQGVFQYLLGQSSTPVPIKHA